MGVFRSWAVRVMYICLNAMLSSFNSCDTELSCT